MVYSLGPAGAGADGGALLEKAPVALSPAGGRAACGAYGGGAGDGAGGAAEGTAGGAVSGPDRPNMRVNSPSLEERDGCGGAADARGGRALGEAGGNGAAGNCGPSGPWALKNRVNSPPC